MMFRAKIKQGIMLGLLGLWLGAHVATAQTPPATVITSDRLEMISGKNENSFFFYGNVKVKGNNLDASCEEMEVVSTRAGTDTEGTIGEIGAIAKIILKDNVVIEQAGRIARAGHAEIYPDQGKVILTENPVVTDSEGVVTGFRMELIQGERVARVYGKPDGSERARVTLPTMPDLGYEQERSGSDGNRRTQ